MLTPEQAALIMPILGGILAAFLAVAYAVEHSRKIKERSEAYQKRMEQEADFNPMEG